jgi:hypothetical protein
MFAAKEGSMSEDSTSTPPTPASTGPSLLARLAASTGQRLVQLAKKPRILLILLAGWSLLALLTQVFVDSGLFLDTHNIELDGALGGLALSFSAAPLVLLYLYCWRDPEHYHSVFWLALLQQAAIAVGVLYQWIIGTFSFESIVIPLVGSVVLGVLSFLQLFEPKGAE